MYKYTIEISIKSDSRILVILEKYLDLFLTILSLASVKAEGIVYIGSRK